MKRKDEIRKYVLDDNKFKDEIINILIENASSFVINMTFYKYFLNINNEDINKSKKVINNFINYDLENDEGKRTINFLDICWNDDFPQYDPEELINNRIINDLNNIFYDFLILIKAKLYEESLALMEELLKCKVRFKILTAEFNSENDSNEDNKILIRNLYESKFINRSYAMNNLLTLYYHLWNKVKTKDDNDDNIISTLKMYRTNVGKIKKNILL